MRPTRLAALVPALALIAGAATLPAAAEDIPEGMVIAYACDGGGELSVTYINPAEGQESFAVVLHEGGMVPMKAGPTGSGVRYVSTGEPKLVWHTKGNVGFLAHDDADETIILKDCNEVD